MPSFKKIINKLIDKNISISVAESCTGGLLSSTITSVPGVSKIFNMGLIVYSNNAKISLLKINKGKLKKFGSVSKEIAQMMSKNLNKISKSELCISTTGIAGPEGGSKEKPVGLVFIGILYKRKYFIIKNIFNGNRKEIQKKTVNHVLEKIESLI
tara:strand:+ start:168 stop:632 length:465 start_codon:yes stop_codon:yes gene_type:complete